MSVNSTEDQIYKGMVDLEAAVEAEGWDQFASIYFLYEEKYGEDYWIRRSRMEIPEWAMNTPEVMERPFLVLRHLTKITQMGVDLGVYPADNWIGLAFVAEGWALRHDDEVSKEEVDQVAKHRLIRLHPRKAEVRTVFAGLSNGALYSITRERGGTVDTEPFKALEGAIPELMNEVVAAMTSARDEGKRRREEARANSQGGIWKISGKDAMDGQTYPLPGEWESEEDARSGALMRLMELEKSQPTESSGGQSPMGIQDRVYIHRPDGSRYRFTLDFGEGL